MAIGSYPSYASNYGVNSAETSLAQIAQSLAQIAAFMTDHYAKQNREYREERTTRALEEIAARLLDAREEETYKRVLEDLRKIVSEGNEGVHEPV